MVEGRRSPGGAFAPPIAGRGERLATALRARRLGEHAAGRGRPPRGPGADAAHRGPVRAATVAGPFRLFVDRRALAAFSAWYEMFPRSEGAVPPRSGTLRTAAARLPAIAEMGFDIVYLPPIHPIGTTYRKGPNNSLVAGPEDVGSPWAIGRPRAATPRCTPSSAPSPTSTPSWPRRAGRARGGPRLRGAVQPRPPLGGASTRVVPPPLRRRIRYAENPPKRYQDIFPVDFETEDRDGAVGGAARRDALLDGPGVRVVPGRQPPHQAPALLGVGDRGAARARSRGDLPRRGVHPPAGDGARSPRSASPSRTPTSPGGPPSRSSPSTSPSSRTTERVDWFRPNFWVNTPDILHEVLQRGGPPAFRLRLVLAALAVASWGMYSGLRAV